VFQNYKNFPIIQNVLDIFCTFVPEIKENKLAFDFLFLFEKEILGLRPEKYF